MSIWNKILVWVIGVASVALFYMAARTLKTHQYWRELAQKYERKIEQVQEQNHVLLEGGGNQGDRRNWASGSVESSWTSCCWTATGCGSSATRRSS